MFNFWTNSPSSIHHPPGKTHGNKQLLPDNWLGTGGSGRQVLDSIYVSWLSQPHVMHTPSIIKHQATRVTACYEPNSWHCCPEVRLIGVATRLQTHRPCRYSLIVCILSFSRSFSLLLSAFPLAAHTTTRNTALCLAFTNPDGLVLPADSRFLLPLKTLVRRSTCSHTHLIACYFFQGQRKNSILRSLNEAQEDQVGRAEPSLTSVMGLRPNYHIYPQTFFI